jgi:hypothetical protein
MVMTKEAQMEPAAEGPAEEIRQLQAQIDDLEGEVAQLRHQLVDAELDQWRARIDDLEVQVHLGSLDARDRLSPLVEDLRNAWLDARAGISSTSDTASDVVDKIRSGLEQAMREVRRVALDTRSAIKG